MPRKKKETDKPDKPVPVPTHANTVLTKPEHVKWLAGYQERVAAKNELTKNRRKEHASD